MPKTRDGKMLWEETKTKIKSAIGEQDFSRWFKFDFVEAAQDKITLSTSSKMVVDQINRRYSRIIETTMRELAGRNIALDIHITSESPTQKPSKGDEKHATSSEHPQPAKTEKRLSAADIGEPVRERSSKKIAAIQLNEEFVFDNYVIGENNAFAVNAAKAVAMNPGIEYNPLFIYGGVGLGKTHLIQAIGNYAAKNSDCMVIYTTAENFTNEFIDSTAKGKQAMNDFKRKYRKADILLIDDIHFLERKPQSQEELFNTYNTLYQAKKQMVFTCDRPVAELKQIAERLTSRLGSGLPVDIQIPLYETRYAILQKKIETTGIPIPDDVINLICKNISTNVRDMIAALNKLTGYAKLTKKDITLATAQQQLKDIFTSPKLLNVTIETIAQVIAFEHGITLNDIRGKNRKKQIVTPRHIAMYIAHNITELSTTEIGQFFGRDHSSVTHAEEKIKKQKQENPYEEERIQNLIKIIKEQSVK